jgi:Fe-S-cluster-containing hydrogenase component 2
MTYVITENCIDNMDKSCMDDCVDCGACLPVCPVDAIYYEDDLPDSLLHYKEINKEFFNKD